jgi:3-oxoacyl-[acyl-carrier protein] reductase
MLQNKNAIIYGAGGSLGSAVARAFAAAGARVFLTGRNLGPLKKLADEITSSGGIAEAEPVDALDETAVNTHIAKVVQQVGTVDISFNAVGYQVVQNVPLTTISVNDFTSPVSIAMRTHFITAIAAANVMMEQNSGVIITLTATPGGIGYPYTGGFGPACCAIEGFSRNLASELGIYGIRVVNIRSAGSPDSKVFMDAIESYPEEMKSVIQTMEQDTMLKKLPLIADIANTAVFLASGMAGKITGVTVDVTSGTTAGLNYKAPAGHPLHNRQM